MNSLAASVNLLPMMKSLLLLSLSLGQLYAGTVYSSMTTDLGTSLIFTDQPTSIFQAGDQIAFSDLLNNLASARIGTYNQSGANIVSNATFRLYNVNVTNVNAPMLSTLLTTVTLMNVSFSSAAFTFLDFNLVGTTAFQNALWTLQFSAATDLGINNFTPPTIGSSNADT